MPDRPPHAAKPCAERCIALCKASGNLRTLTWCLDRLAALEQASGNYDHAIALYQEALGYSRRLGRTVSLSTQLGNIGNCPGQCGATGS